MPDPMHWFRVEVGWRRHPKFQALEAMGSPGRLAILDYWTLVAWSFEHLTDGHVPPGIPRLLGVAPRSLRALVDVRLLDLPDDERQGHLVHNFTKYQPTAATVEARSKANTRNAQVRWAGARSHPRGAR